VLCLSHNRLGSENGQLDVGRLTKLHTLKMSSCSLANIPHGLANLSMLVSLDLSANNILRLSKFMAGLQMLKVVCGVRIAVRFNSRKFL
jgi:Leucine-rich repeat (LRR) protein